MLRTVVYPYASEYDALFQKLINAQAETITYELVSPQNWTSVATSENVSVSTDYALALEKADELIIIDSPKAHFLYADIVSKIEQALALHKEVFCAIKLKEEDLGRIRKRSAENNGFRYLFEPNRDYCLMLDKDESLIRQNCIVVTVAGMIRGMNLTKIGIELADEYEKRGYRVAVISGYANCELLPNHYLIPENIFSAAVSEYVKVLLFNKFIAEVEERSNAEILIVCLTDGIMSYSETYYGDFGFTASEQATALDIDYFVLEALPEFLGTNPENVMQELKMLCKYRLGSEIDAVVLQNCEVDEYELATKGNYAFLMIDPEKTLDLLSNLLKMDDGLRYYEGWGASTCADIAEESIEFLSEQIDIF